MSAFEGTADLDFFVAGCFGVFQTPPLVRRWSRQDQRAVCRNQCGSGGASLAAAGRSVSGRAGLLHGSAKVENSGSGAIFASARSAAFSFNGSRSAAITDSISLRAFWCERAE